MKRRLSLLFAGLIVTALFVLLQVLHVVHMGYVTVITTFGKPEKTITEPGLYVKWPWPVQKAHVFDNRIHCYEGSLEQTLTRDGKNIIVMMYAGWRIADPVTFLERMGTIEEADRSLEGLIRNYKNGVLGRYPFSALVNVDKTQLKFEEIERKVLAAVQPEAAQRYGIDVRLLGIRRIGLPEAITEAVFDRMRGERQTVAVTYRSEGEKEAAVIEAEADKKARMIIADAEAGAKRIRAEGDASAAEFYGAFEKNTELAMFLLKLEALEETLKERATVILGTETQPYDLLKGDTPLPTVQPKK